MPVKVKKIDGKFCAVEPSGGAKKGRCHKSRKKAVAQVRAINMSLRRAGKI
jgi:hypothetical protein